MRPTFDRRRFLKDFGRASAGLGLAALTGDTLVAADGKMPFRISLAEWSLHQTIQAGKLDNLGFPEFTKKQFDIDAIEYVNQFFKDKAKDQDYLAELKKRVADLGATSLLIMIDDEGDLGDADDTKRKQAVENHYPWVEAAKFLGCHSIRVNARSSGTADEQRQRAVDGLRQLCEFAANHQINIIVENHGGLSSNGAWLAAVIKEVNLPNCGTLPDFGNFDLGDGQSYDRYLGVKELMPFAKGVSAKSCEFDDNGNEVQTDFRQMMQIVLDASYDGYVGIEYEGKKHSEIDGIRLTKALLEKIRSERA